ncbi:hypothetical protein ABZ916_39470 [Streptomyces sp. NPDC046853]|uniref:hypothetical protein n=1 Tax=Streptomyces sp. NPDC046853 TaxID=3154920 RepID=UPI0033C1FC5F
MFRKGKHTTRELIRRLRAENRYFERQRILMQARLTEASQLLKTEKAQREVSDGLVLKQTAQLEALVAENAELKRELAERTVEMALPQLPSADLTGVAA